ncbi:MAG: BON domain-containing protein [Caldilineaceae bacterium]|nr:BON domain-containing protein [Caldilineaceae bacterium]MCB0090945.1 BON domain-containing protein [Caldilineaceae bacterium]MCB0139953.1 BON domain-containing protein [Caldilineaceae bacterium]
MRWPFSKKYDDSQIIACAESALEIESMIQSRDLAVTSEKGVVMLSGKVRSRIDKSRATDVVLNSLTGASLKFERIVDNIVVN